MDEFTFKCFLAVARTGSFTAAASELKRTQSAITHQIYNLEKILMTILFNRKDGITLTKEGEKFLSYATKFESLQNEIHHKFRKRNIEDKVTFGIPESFAATHLKGILASFKLENPNTILTIECDQPLNLLKRLNQGFLDLIFMKNHSLDNFPPEAIVFSEPLYWVNESGANFPISINKPIPLVLSPEPCPHRIGALIALEKAGLEWEIVYSSSNFASCIAAVKANIGITVFPRPGIPHGLKIITGSNLPPLFDTYFSIIKRSDCSPSTIYLEHCMMEKINQLRKENCAVASKIRPKNLI